MNLFLAGTETTSSTIKYGLNALIKYPNIQGRHSTFNLPVIYVSYHKSNVFVPEKMQQEIDAVIGKERCPNMEDRKSLPFTDAAIHEIQRYLDITPFSVPHYALKDISFRGYTIPKVLARQSAVITSQTRPKRHHCPNRTL